MLNEFIHNTPFSHLVAAICNDRGQRSNGTDPRVPVGWNVVAVAASAPLDLWHIVTYVISEEFQKETDPKARSIDWFATPLAALLRFSSRKQQKRPNARRKLCNEANFRLRESNSQSIKSVQEQLKYVFLEISCFSMKIEDCYRKM
jgi:hypothetical protein